MFATRSMISCSGTPNCWTTPSARHGSTRTPPGLPAGSPSPHLVVHGLGYPPLGADAAPTPGTPYGHRGRREQRRGADPQVHPNSPWSNQLPSRPMAWAMGIAGATTSSSVATGRPRPMRDPRPDEHPGQQPAGNPQATLPDRGRVPPAALEALPVGDHVVQAMELSRGLGIDSRIIGAPSRGPLALV